MLRDEDADTARFQRSLLTRESTLHSVAEILQWVAGIRQATDCCIEPIPLARLDGWSFDDRQGALCHRSGRFFRVEGVRVQTNLERLGCWEQPILNQPEVGFLGLLAREIDGVLHFLLQAKIEPGNLNQVQLSPTLQATRSNYTRIHLGRAPAYLDYFNGEQPTQVIVDQLQSEQGGRFLHKRNRNMVVELDADTRIPVHDAFRWATLGQIKQLMAENNLVNMDLRSLVAGMPLAPSQDPCSADAVSDAVFGEQRGDCRSLFDDGPPIHSFNQLISWITRLKFRYELTAERIPVQDVRHWHYDGNCIHHEDHKYFSVIGVDVKIAGREVAQWQQPMIRPAQEGILGFLVQRVGGVLHFLVQAKVEAGNFDTLELAPTVQCLTGNYRPGHNAYEVPFLDEFLQPDNSRVWHRSLQSEEGGRFFQEQNLNIIVELDESRHLELPENYCWMTLRQLMVFLQFNNYLNIGARSLISLLCP
ncbi:MULTISPECIES: NDP-hexose 2,3-dehydratase family protein [Thiorhodovibrio]|uniref:NDP-hexose 2,3-dehydratase family protein n=1 Tax=Thiorhodovibrio TaxID=61593 RepID=UPI001913ADF6|nr:MULTISPECIES: NDP-hexose 2,3-dehydratase family protein [Thiorhodovibrio]MBK5970256.1 NDP-hexose 2,3-dehydratase [Thiorhodovibrio winogradskyi]WPL14820.1 NDP-hexose 2,3-dehydratase [Thiorhodovibrio litoralis]